MEKRTSKKKNLKYVIDTNIFVISLTSRSPYHSIYTDLINGRFDILVSTEILLEYEEIIIEKYGIKTADFFLGLLTELPNVKFISPSYYWNLIETDLDDNKYVDCAIAGSADCIVSEDNHFNILKDVPFPIVKVISIEKFMEVISKHKL